VVRRQTAAAAATATAMAMAAALALGAGAAGCRKEEAPPATRVEERGEGVKPVRRSPPQVSGGIAKEGFAVYRDAASFAEAWKVANAHIAPLPAPPTVDFGKEMACLAALGEKPTGGWSVEVVGARKDGGKLLVLYAVRGPKPGEFVGQAKTNPWDLVYLPVDAGAPEWVKYEPPVAPAAGK
jgi:hypothetical protein